MQAPFGKRSRDAFGIAATYVRFSSHSGAGFDLDSELVWESYYKWTIGKHVALIPDFQFLHQPGGLLANRDCPLLSSRVVVSF
jgi:carbohydrate-selective porin OprB